MCTVRGEGRVTPVGAALGHPCHSTHASIWRLCVCVCVCNCAYQAYLCTPRTYEFTCASGKICSLKRSSSPKINHQSFPCVVAARRRRELADFLFFWRSGVFISRGGRGRARKTFRLFPGRKTVPVGVALGSQRSAGHSEQGGLK